MIINARMYSVSPAAQDYWRALLEAIGRRARLPLSWVDHAAPEPLDDLWARPDQAAVYMCGLPFSRAAEPPLLVAAPVPSPAAYDGQPRYWSNFVVRRDSFFHSLPDTFGSRIAFTVPGSQSGYAAPLRYLMSLAPAAPRPPAPPSTPAARPLYREIVAPTITPMGALRAVLEGAADVAPIDSYAFDLLEKFSPHLTDQVRIVARTPPTPIPPLVASPGCLTPATLGALRAAFADAHRQPEAYAAMTPLLLARFETPDAATYASLASSLTGALAHWRAIPLAEVTHPAFEI